MDTKLNRERCIVVRCWMDHQRAIMILEDAGSKFDMTNFIKKEKEQMEYLEKKYPWLKGIVKILSSKTPCPIGEYEL